MLQSANYGRPDGHNSPELGSGTIDFLRRCSANFVTLDVQHVGFDGLIAEWKKSPESDMQSDFGNLDTARANLVEDCRREMQAGGRRGCRAARAREYCLVALAI